MAWADDVVTLHIKQAEVKKIRKEILNAKRVVLELIADKQHHDALMLAFEIEPYERQANTMQAIIDSWRKQLGL